MNKKIIFTGILVISIFGLFLFRSPREVKGEMTVYVGSDCGCCEIYVGIMRRSYDVDVEVLNLSEMEELKRRKKIPDDLYSCHTSVIDDYVIEGHIPMEAIEKLRDSKSDLMGIGMADMPQGSPGMPGIKRAPFRIYGINEAGEVNNLFLEL